MADVASAHSKPAVFVNGQIVGAGDAQLSIYDRGLLYGFGFFETFRTSGGRPHHWSFNHARLMAACEKATLALPPTFLVRDAERLSAVVGELLRGVGWDDAVFRYTVTAGIDDRPSEILTMRPLPNPPAADGIRLRVLNLRRDNGEWLPRPKSLSYLNTMLGARELLARNASLSDEGVFLSRAGEFVVETVRQNIAWVVDDRIHIPDAAVGAVAGTCLAWLRTRGLAVESVRASLGELLQADAIFVLNSVRGITPVAEVWDAADAARLGVYNSASHPLVVALQRDWREALAQSAQPASP